MYQLYLFHYFICLADTLRQEYTSISVLFLLKWALFCCKVYNRRKSILQQKQDFPMGLCSVSAESPLAISLKLLLFFQSCQFYRLQRGNIIAVVVHSPDQKLSKPQRKQFVALAICDWCIALRCSNKLQNWVQITFNLANWLATLEQKTNFLSQNSQEFGT